jgi:hypothetical protein
MMKIYAKEVMPKQYLEESGLKKEKTMSLGFNIYTKGEERYLVEELDSGGIVIWAKFERD